MKPPSTYSFARYLASKKTVDDRALNRSVWDKLKSVLAAKSGSEPLKILEVGAGIGTMVERTVEWELFDRADYLALDSIPENIEEAASRVPVFLQGLGYDHERLGSDAFRFSGHGREGSVRFEAANVLDFMATQANRSSWDLLLANAFLDLVDVPSALPDLMALLKPGGLFYFTITFDGATILQPEIDPILDAQIERLYHETMDNRMIGGKLSGDSRTGRHFFHHVRSAGGELLAAGASDWVVFAGPQGYHADEAFFLHFILHTIGSALQGHTALDQERLESWVRKRHAQVHEKTLVYIAHQMDFLGSVP